MELAGLFVAAFLAATILPLARAASSRLGHATTVRSARALRWLQRYGPPALLLSWVPLIGDGIVILAGAARVPVGTFSFWTLLGKAARYLVVAWIAQSQAVRT